MMILSHRQRIVGVLIGALVLTSVLAPVSADVIGPSARDRQIAITVAALLRREHLSKHELDDEISERCLETFLKSLDVAKVYFYQSDIDAFLTRKHSLDDGVKRGDIQFAFTVFQTFLKRVDERIKLVDEFLAAEHDFTVDEEMIVDPDAATYARNEAEAREKWRKRIKYDLLILKADGKEGQEAIDKLSRRYHSFARRMHQTDNEELLEMYLTALTTSYDPHTTYMSPRTVENFEIQMRLELEGIGAALRSEEGYTIVTKIIPGGAADREGTLQEEDKIVGVGQGHDGEIEDVMEMKLPDVVQRIRGKRDTIVRLEVISAESSERKVIEITRAKIELKDAEARGQVFEEGRKPGGERYKIGVIDLPSFYMDMAGARRGLPNFRSTTRDVRKILEEFNEEAVDALILDLRRNGGGSLQEAINLTGLFIEEGPVVQVKDADGYVQPYHDLDSDILWKGPLIVLTSKFSASASEILAGAIQDYARGLVVGDDSTHGKGTVQSLMDLGQRLFRSPNNDRLGALKVTMQQFYRPNGDSTQERGVLADIKLPSITSHLDGVSEADLDYPMAFDRVEPLEYRKVNRVSGGIRDRLTHLSADRVKHSEDFQRVLRDIGRYREQKDRVTVTLNEEKFLKEREELNADREDKKLLEELNDPGGNGIERNYYLDEAIAIALDYLQMTMVAQAR
jgi:carboxyl-terminal processing protease